LKSRIRHASETSEKLAMKDSVVEKLTNEVQKKIADAKE
jgi:hypothetical protein